MIRKALLLLSILFLIAISVSGQVTVTVFPSDTIVCYNDSMAFRAVVTGAGPFTYQWQKNNVDVQFPVDTSILVFPHVLGSDTAFYRCIVSNGIDRDTSENAHLRMRLKMNIDTLYRVNALGCPGICKGQYKVVISGGAPPYHYDWHDPYEQDSSFVFGLCPGPRVLTVTDTNHCSISKDFIVDVIKLPKVDFTRTPEDTVIYLSNPNISVQFPDTAKPYMETWSWNFGEDTTAIDIGVNPASHTYTKPGQFTISLHFTDLNGCDTTIQHYVTVKIADLDIRNCFTPRGKNPTFEIHFKDTSIPLSEDYRRAYLDTELTIYDRWGKKIYSKVNYKSGDWDGGNHPDGVYYYLLKCHGQYGDQVFKGSVTIIATGFPTNQ